jgi:DNA replication protein DnaC
LSALWCTPEEAPALLECYPKLLAQLGLTDVADLDLRLGAAGWSLERVRAECEMPGARERFDAAVEAGRSAEVERQVSRRMKIALGTGPIVLASLPVEELADFAPDTTLRKVAREYAPAEHGGRLVCGPTGIGKSVAGIAALRRFLHRTMLAQLAKPQTRDWMTGGDWTVDHSQQAAWIRAFDLPNARLAQSLGKGEADLVTLAMRVGFLVLDDLGWESKRAGADDVVTEVIAARYDAGRVTYATTGLKLEQFEARYSSAIVRRLIETGRVKGKVLDRWPSEGGK